MEFLSLANFFNFLTLTPKYISPFPTNLIHTLHDYNWKMVVKDEYEALSKNKMWS